MANDNERERSQDTYSFHSLYEKAGHAVVRAEKLYHDWDVGKRLTGAGIGARVGMHLGRLGGPYGLVIAPVIGAVVGAAYGPEGIDRAKDAFDKAIGRFKPERLPAPEQDQEDPMDKRYPHKLDL